MFVYVVLSWHELDYLKKHIVRKKDKEKYQTMEILLTRRNNKSVVLILTILFFLSVDYSSSSSSPFILPSIKRIQQIQQTTLMTTRLNARGGDADVVVSLVSRGGADEYDNEYEDEYDDSDEETSSTSSNTEISSSVSVELDMPTLTKKILKISSNAILKTAFAIQRAVKAGFHVALLTTEDVDDEEEQEEKSVITKVMDVLSAMWDAVFQISNNDENDDEMVVEDEAVAEVAPVVNKKKKGEKARLDMSDYFASNYGVDISSQSDDDDDDAFITPTILGGSFSDALRTSRSKARLLVVFIPSTYPSKKRKQKQTQTFDQIAIKSLTSQPVQKVLENKGGSFLIWGAKYNSPEAAQAMKRLKKLTTSTSQKNKKSPLIAVLYPASTYVNGAEKIYPKILAQHHCNPPPSPMSTKSFLSALRKRHSTQIKQMRFLKKEQDLLKERQSNYKESLVLDTQREVKEKKIAEELRKKRELEKQKKQELELKLQKYRDMADAAFERAADEESENNEDVEVMNIALRFADGRNDVRKVKSDEDLNLLFYWIEGHFGWEKEKVVITPMKALKRKDKRSMLEFEGNDENEDEVEDSTERESLHDFFTDGGKLAASKMIGLRVSLKKDKEEESDDVEDDE